MDGGWFVGLLPEVDRVLPSRLGQSMRNCPRRLQAGYGVCRMHADELEAFDKLP